MIGFKQMTDDGYAAGNGYLYRCKKSDPLETVKVGELYRLKKWRCTFIVCGEGFAINERVMPEYFERLMEKED